MTKTFCDVCGKPGGVLALEVFKIADGKRIELAIATRADGVEAHICDRCSRDLLQEAVDKLNCKISNSTEPAYSPL